jgi:predicted DNA-binding protein (MmcQ/YjbR family)
MATEDFPWGVRVAKVNGKIFVFLGSAGDGKDVISVKLPVSFEAARALLCSEPTKYGLGCSHWMTIDLDHAECLPVDLLEDWIEESYRAIAPARLVAELDRARARIEGGDNFGRTESPRRSATGPPTELPT